MLVAIGGGNMREMPLVNDYIISLLADIRLREERKPRVLFFPTASFESKPYVNSFNREFKTRLKCKTTCGLWLGGEMDYEHIREKFDKVDAIYIGGGRYDVLVREFAVMGIDRLLNEFHNKGGLIIGNSAGAMLFYERCISDYKIMSGESDSYEIASGYGWLKGCFCPHSNEPLRRSYISDNNICDVCLLEEYEYLVYGNNE